MLQKNINLQPANPSLFIDAATVNSAHGIIRLGSRRSSDSWDMYCVREVTYRLLEGNLRVLPTMGREMKPVGPYHNLVKKLPELEDYKFSDKSRAEEETHLWFSRHLQLFTVAWNGANQIRQFPEWRDSHKEIAFVHHVKRHGSLFEESFIPYISKVLGHTDKELYALHGDSKNLKLVAEWSKSYLEGEVKLATDAWMLAGMMRHVFHVSLIRLTLKGYYELISHPFRDTINVNGNLKEGYPKINSLSYFANLIIESVLDSADPAVRVDSWLRNIKESREAIREKRIVLPKTDDTPSAVKHAIRAARDLRLPVSSIGYQRAFETLQIKDYRGLSEIPEFYELLPHLKGLDRFSLLIQILSNFSTIAGHLKNRQHRRPGFQLRNEYDTQDLLFSVIRAAFEDARKEEWTPKHAGRAKRIDIVIPSIGVVIEVKHIRDAGHARRIDEELKIDFESYHTHSNCQTLLALIYDPNGLIIDPFPITHDLSGRRVKGDHSFDVKVFIQR